MVAAASDADDDSWNRPLDAVYFRERPVLPDPKQRPVITAEEAFAELGIDRSTGYKSIRDGTFPVPVLRIGRIIRVPTVALRRVLLLDVEDVQNQSEPTEAD